MVVYLIALAAAIGFVVLCIYCAFTENKRIGRYKFYGVFSRFNAYLATSLLMAGIAMAILVPVLELTEPERSGFVQVLMDSVLPGISMFCLGLFMTIRIRRRCGCFLPDAQKTCVRDMIFCALGVACKFTVFFIRSVWIYAHPSPAVDINGNKLYIWGNGVYHKDGTRVGDLTFDGYFVPNEDFYRLCRI